MGAPVSSPGWGRADVGAGSVAASIARCIEAAKPPPGVVSWLGLLVFMVLLAHPLLLGHWTPDSLPGSGRTEQDMVLLLQDVAILSAGVVLKFEHAASARPSVWWLAVALMTIAMQKLPVSLLAVAGSTEARIGRFDEVSAALVAAVTVALLAAAAWAPRALPLNSFAVAFGLSAVLAAVRLRRSSGLEEPEAAESTWLLVLITAVSLLVVLLLVASLRTIAVWYRMWLFAAAALIVVSNAGSRRDELSPAPLWVAACGIVGVSILLAGTVALLRTTKRAAIARLLVLTHRAALAEAAERAGRAQVHEVTATIAGIASAARLLTRADERTEERRRLASMLDAEMARLDRLLDHHDPRPRQPMGLGQVLGPAVSFQRDLGRSVTWTGPDLTVLADPDDVTEILLGLLSNADRHARGAPVDIATSTSGGLAEVRVSDAGPGVDRRVRAELFEWGARREGSTGQGIGLQVARDLARRLGGDLQLAETRRGATFVLTLPLVKPGTRTSAAPARPHLAPASGSLE